MRFIYRLALGFGLFFGGSALAIDARAFAALYPFKQIRADLAQDQTLERLHYELLKERFDNNDFQEILFSDQSSRSRRLTPEAHRRMFEVIVHFMEQSLEIQPDSYLRERPHYKPFTIKRQKGQTEVRELELGHAGFGLFLDQLRQSFLSSAYLSPLSSEAQLELVRLVARKFPKVKSLFDLSASHLLDDADLRQEVLRSYTSLYRMDKSPECLKAAELLVLGSVLQNSLLFRSTPSFADFDQLDLIYLREALSGLARKMIASEKLPGKLARDVFGLAGYQDQDGPALPASGYVVVPMSRWEKLFKGIGPGECIRATCNRFFDALYPGSLAFAIIKDGKEIGYIGLYKVREFNGVEKFWYVDAIQSPALVSDDGEDWVFDGLMSQIARLALRDGARLAVPDADWTAYNFREVVSRLVTHGVTEVVNVAWDASKILDEIYAFVRAPEQADQQRLAEVAGYKPKLMFDSLLRNSYSVRVLEAPRDFNDFELRQSRGLQVSSNLNKVSPRQAWRQYLWFQKNSLSLRNTEEGRRQLASMFPVLTSYDPNFNFSNELYLDPSPDDQDGQVIELLHLASSPQEIIDVLQKFGRSSAWFSQIILNYVVPRLNAQTLPVDWNQFFAVALRLMGNDEPDIALAHAVLKRLKTPSEFLAFTMTCVGKGETSAYVGERKLRDRMISASFTRFAKQVPEFYQLTSFGERILNQVKSKADVKLRGVLLDRAHSLEEITAVMKLSKAPNRANTPSYHRVLAQAVVRVFKEGKDLNPVSEAMILSALSADERTALVVEAIRPARQIKDAVQITRASLEFRLAAAPIATALGIYLKLWPLPLVLKDLELPIVAANKDFALIEFLRHFVGNDELPFPVPMRPLFAGLWRAKSEDERTEITTWINSLPKSAREGFYSEIGLKKNGRSRTINLWNWVRRFSVLAGVRTFEKRCALNLTAAPDSRH